MKVRKLPTGIQDFEDIRTSGCIYAGKTGYVYRLVTGGKRYGTAPGGLFIPGSLPSRVPKQPIMSKMPESCRNFQGKSV
jgi:hypothetical protein